MRIVSAITIAWLVFGPMAAQAEEIPQVLRGEITAIDRNTRILSVRTPSGMETLPLTERTEVLPPGPTHEVAFDQLRVGQWIEASVIDSPTEGRVVTAVRIAPAAPILLEPHV